jgi:hypothetical protein
MSYYVSCRSITAQAAVDLSSLQYHFGAWSSGQITSGGTNLTAQGLVAGIIGEAVSTAGNAFPLVVPDGGIAMIKLGATLSQGAVVATSAAGKAIAHGSTAGDRAWGVLLTGGVDDDVVPMQFYLCDIDAGS